MEKEIEKLREKLNKIHAASPGQKIILNFKEARAYLGFSKNHLHKLCYSGKIPHHNPTGRRLFFFKHEIDEWVEGRVEDQKYRGKAAVRSKE